MNIKAYAANKPIEYEHAQTVTISLFRLLLTLALVLSFSLILMWSRINFTAASYKRASLVRETQQLSRQIDRFNLEIATLKSRSRIERIAKARMNMGYPTAEQIIVINR